MNEIGTIKLKTERLVLRSVEKNDAKELFEGFINQFEGFINQKEFLYYTNKKPVSLEEEKASLENIEEKYKNKNYYNWLITLKDTKQIIGAINLNVNLKNDSVMFNYAIDNRFIKKGYMTETLTCVKNFAFNKMKVNRFEGGCVVKKYCF